MRKREQVFLKVRYVVWEKKWRLTKLIICFLGYIYFHDWIKEPSGGNNVPRTLYKAKKVLTLKGPAD